MTKMEKLMAAVTFLCVPFWMASFLAVYLFWIQAFWRGGTLAVLFMLAYFVRRSWTVVSTRTLPFVRVHSRFKVWMSVLAAVFWVLVIIGAHLDGLVRFQALKRGEMCFAVFTNLALVANYVTAFYFVLLAFLRHRFRRAG